MMWQPVHDRFVIFNLGHKINKLRYFQMEKILIPKVLDCSFHFIAYWVQNIFRIPIENKDLFMAINIIHDIKN